MEEMEIRFLNPNARLENEKRSKLLHTDSALYRYLEKQRTLLTNLYKESITEKRMDFHIELIRGDEEPTDSVLVERAQSLEGQKIDGTIGTYPKFIAVLCPKVVGYGETHSTIAYFPNGVPINLNPKLFF